VVTAPHQFATATTPKSFDVANLAAFQKAWKIAGDSINNWSLPVGERRLVVPHANHFATAAVSPAWERNRTGVTIGAHTFYAVN
jgi:hypothetical protein